MKPRRRKKIKRYMILGTVMFLISFDLTLLARYGWRVTGL